MSDAGVRELLDQMEAWLGKNAFPEGLDALKAWQERFSQEAEGAERGEGWEEIAERAHALAPRLAVIQGRLEEAMAVIRKELVGQSAGSRALKAYRPAQG